MLYEHLTLDIITAAGVATVLVDLVNGPQYQNARYTRAVAARRASSLAGQSRYAEVEDEITIDVLGPTYGACIRNAEKLWGILDQAAEWEEGGHVDAIQLRMRAPVSEIGDVTTMVLGPAPGAAPGEFAPEQDVAAPGSPWVLRGVTLRFRSRGRLLTTRESAGASESSGNPTVETITFTTDAGRVASPLGVGITSSSDFVGESPLSVTVKDGFLLTAADSSAIELIDASRANTINPAFTTPDDSSHFPYSGGDVLRFTPSTTDVFGTTVSAGGFSGVLGYEQIGVLIAVRNNSASVPFLIRPTIRTLNGTLGHFAYGQWTIVGTDTQQPQLINLGTISLRGIQSVAEGARLGLELRVPTTSGSPSLDISHIALIALDAPDANVLAVANTLNGESIHILSPEVMNAARAGIVGSGAVAFDNANVGGNAYRGNLAMDCRGTTLTVCYLRTQGDNWTVVDTGAGAKANFTFDAYRRRAFLSPQ